MSRNRAQLLQALTDLAQAQRAGAVRSQRIEEHVKRHIEAGLDALRGLAHPPPAAVLNALGLPLNVSEQSWRAAANLQMKALREMLVRILRRTRELRQEERKTRPRIDHLKATILGISGIATGPALAEAEGIVSDLEEANSVILANLENLEAAAREIGLFGASTSGSSGESSV